MKKTFAVMLVATTLYVSACGSNKSSDANTDSTNSGPNINASDNNNSTNPSIPDTAFTDTANKMKDTLKR
jgi:hypothetical protein